MGKRSFTIGSLAGFVTERWVSGTYIEEAEPMANEVLDLPWVPYESYMRAQLIDCEPGQIGELRIVFPADSSEDNRMHIHPASDRLIMVVSGSGEFVAERNGQTVRHHLYPGTRIYMPRGVLHTFYAGSKGMLVHALHNPWVPIEDEQCLIYPG